MASMGLLYFIRIVNTFLINQSTNVELHLYEPSLYLCFPLTAKKRKSQMRFLGLYIKVSSNGLSVDTFIQWTKMTCSFNSFSTDMLYLIQ